MSKDIRTMPCTGAVPVWPVSGSVEEVLPTLVTLSW